MAEHLVCESEAAPPPSFIYKRVEDMIQQPTPFASRLEESMRVVDEALDRYGEDGLALTFNGGKDCTVLLHLLCAALEKRKSVTAPTNGKRRTDRLKCLYVENHAVFPEVEKFVAQSERQYDLDLVKIKSDMKSALRSYMDMRPGVKAFLVGTRRNDPHGTKLQYFTPSDPDWPPLMRVCPILEWTYEDVWRFIRGAKVPYCELYNKGYTSIGNVDTTSPNPKLYQNGKYIPAYHLKEGHFERCGRKQSLQDS